MVSHAIELVIECGGVCNPIRDSYRKKKKTKIPTPTPAIVVPNNFRRACPPNSELSRGIDPQNNSELVKESIANASLVVQMSTRWNLKICFVTPVPRGDISI